MSENPNQAVETELEAILARLPVPVALKVLTEMTALVLSRNGIVPETDEFQGFMATYEASLAGRIVALRRKEIAASN
jgi:hypothetical protein